MDPIIEIISKNIVYNNKYNRKIKDEYIATINRINTRSIMIMEYYRTMNFSLLYNMLHEEILYLRKQQEYFGKYFDKNIMSVLNEYLNERIKLYSEHIAKL